MSTAEQEMMSQASLNVDDEGWTTIVKKQRSITTTKPPKYISKWKATITEKDTTLTMAEQEMISQASLNVDIFCECCQSSLISDVICRSFFRCGRCYCCVGDDPSFDDDEYFENCVYREGVFYKYNKDYHYTKDNDFHKKR